MNNRYGFTLIEVMVALICMVTVLSLTIHFSMSLYDSWKKTALSVQDRMAVYAAIDTIRRDLEHAPCDAHQWYSTGSHELVWHDDLSSQSLRLCLVQGRVERCQGRYDSPTHQWHTRSTSVLMSSVKDIRFILHKNNTYKAVDVIILTQNGYEARALIALGIGALS